MHFGRCARIKEVCKNKTVKRLIILAAVFFIGLQTSFAVVASYCLHEQSTISHPGHHEHDHKVPTEKAGSNLVNDSDCGTCHLTHSSFFTESSVSYLVLNKLHFVIAIDLHFPDLSIPPPYKPNWIPLA